MTGAEELRDAAPLLGCVRPSISVSTCTRMCPKRFRRRGPRSDEALQRRAARSNRRRPEEDDAGKSNVEPPPTEFDMQPLRILSCNIRSIVGKLGELIIISGTVGY